MDEQHSIVLNIPVTSDLVWSDLHIKDGSGAHFLTHTHAPFGKSCLSIVMRCDWGVTSGVTGG